MLVEGGCARDAPNIWGITPLMFSAMYGHAITMEKLIKSDCEVSDIMVVHY